MSEQKREHLGRTVRQEVEIDATPEQVYESWADPERIALWFVDKAKGRAEAGAVQEWFFEHFGAMPIPITKADSPRLIEMAGEIPGRPPFLQEVIIEPAGEGKTRLRVLNSGFGDGAEWDEEYEGVDSGWAMGLAMLKHQLENYPDAPSRTHHLEMRPTDVRPPAAAPHLTDPKAVAQWLGREIDESDILCRTPREMLTAWPARNATLAFKCFAKGEHSFLALDYSAWPGDAEAPREELTAALERLAARLA